MKNKYIFNYKNKYIEYNDPSQSNDSQFDAKNSATKLPHFMHKTLKLNGTNQILFYTTYSKL